MLQERFWKSLYNPLGTWLAAIVLAASLHPGMKILAASDGTPGVRAAHFDKSHPSNGSGVGKAGKGARTSSTTIVKEMRVQGRPASWLIDEFAQLKEALARQDALLRAQQEQIADLRASLDEQKRRLDRTPETPQFGFAGDGTVASLYPAIMNASPSFYGTGSGATPKSLPADSTSATPDETQKYTEKVDELSKSMGRITSGLAGFKFSGDFRLRADGDYRSGNSTAAAVQNSRGRYRMRVYVDKALSDQFDFHVGLGSGRSDNGLTSDSDFTGFDTRSPLYIVEASAGYHPNESVSLRGGKLPEVFADDSRFLFKEEIRFNGFQEIFHHPFEGKPLGVTSVEFRGGQYVLTNPNIAMLPSAKACTVPSTALPPGCAYVAAGYLPGQKVRDADLFHQGLVISGELKQGWHHRFGVDLQLWRNQNQIALAATAAGYAVVLNSSPGLMLAAPITGTGTATATPGGVVFTAAHFQIAHINYRLAYDGVKIRDHEMPIAFDLHASRNLGAGFLRDALMGIASFGETRKPGDIRLLYAFAIKDGNSMISEVTDDYVGSLSGVNIKTNEFRFDLGLTRFLAWQNYLYIINPRRPSDPALHFYVPVPSGANTQYRVQSQLQFKF